MRIGFENRKEIKVSRSMDPFVITNIVVSVLLLASEAMPFIRSNDYNGLLDLIVKKLKKIEPADE